MAPSDPAAGPATAIILAGGRGMRMGGISKARLAWAGGKLIQYIAGEARAAAQEALVVGGATEDVPPGAAYVADVFAGCGPLGGLHAGLTAARFERCLVIGCDMPFVRAEVLRALLALLERHDAAVPRTADGPHPLLAAYSRRCLPVVGEQLAAANLRMMSLLERIDVRWVTEDELRRFDPTLLCLVNINTPQDYQRALELARTGLAAD